MRSEAVKASQINRAHVSKAQRPATRMSDGVPLRWGIRVSVACRIASSSTVNRTLRTLTDGVCVAFLETAALKRLSSTEASLLYSTEPVWACLFGFLVLGERITAATAVGGALIVAACVARSGQAKLPSIDLIS
jgi:hypothetical protein